MYAIRSYYADFYNKPNDKNADDLFENISQNIENPFWGIRGELDNLLQALFSSSIAG